MATSEPAPSRPHVGMLVDDDAASDGRVRRQALALVRAGFDVTLVTVGYGALRTETRLGAVRVIRLAVPWAMRNAQRERMLRRRRWVPPVGHRHPTAARAARARLQAARLGASSSRMPAVTDAVLALRLQVLRATTFSARALRWAFRGGWRAFDATVDSVPVGVSWRRRLPEINDYELLFGQALGQLNADALYVHGAEFVGIVARASAKAAVEGRRVPWVYDVDADVTKPQPVEAAVVDAEVAALQPDEAAVVDAEVAALQPDEAAVVDAEVAALQPDEAAVVDAEVAALQPDEAEVVDAEVAALQPDEAEVDDAEVAALQPDEAELAGPEPEDSPSRRDRAALAALEKDHVRYAARVVAASESLADALQRRFRLASRPVVITAENVSPIADLYIELLGAEGLQARPEEPSDEVEELPVFPARATGEGPLVGIGPANMAGQAWAWAKALERELPGTRTEVLMVDRGGPLIFPSDELVSTATYIRDVQWQESTRDRILSTWTHGLLEAGRPLMGVLYGRTFAADARLMEQAGVKVGLLFHGSELRDPRRHAAAHRWSPFRDTTDAWVRQVQATVDLLRPDIDAFTGPCLVSTPDLLKELRRATWLPVVVDCDVWVPRPERPEPAVPVVVHTPSRAAIKGSAFVDEALAPLVAEGLVEYRRVEGVPPDQMPAVLAEADIVLDQFAIGSYGVLACQAMATGTAVVGHVGPEVRRAVERSTGHVLPIVEATPDSLQDTLRELVATPALRRAAAQAGPPFIRAVHDGKLSARVLAEVLGIGPDVTIDQGGPAPSAAAR
jgi:hypothetical protein